MSTIGWVFLSTSWIISVGYGIGYEYMRRRVYTVEFDLAALQEHVDNMRSLDRNQRGIELRVVERILDQEDRRSFNDE